MFGCGREFCFLSRVAFFPVHDKPSSFFWWSPVYPTFTFVFSRGTTYPHLSTTNLIHVSLLEMRSSRPRFIPLSSRPPRLRFFFFSLSCIFDPLLSDYAEIGAPPQLSSSLYLFSDFFVPPPLFFSPSEKLSFSRQ